MSPPRPKQHHYVTRAYLEGFVAQTEKQLVCYGRGNRGPFRKQPSDLAIERNYYAIRTEKGDWDDSLEHLLGQHVEDPGLCVVGKLRARRFNLTWVERVRLARLIAFQELRTPAARERVRMAQKLLGDRIVEEVRAGDSSQESVQLVGKDGNTITATLAEIAEHERIMSDDHSVELHRAQLGAALELTKWYQHLKFTVHCANGGGKFITTDTPVIRVFSTTAALGSGIQRPDLEVRFPVSQDLLLTLTHDFAFYEKLQASNKSRRRKLIAATPEVRVAQANVAQVSAFNKGHARHARHWVFASKEEAWVPEVLSQPCLAPQIHDHTSGDLIHFQSEVKYNPQQEKT